MLGGVGLLELVGPETPVTGLALGQRVDERGDVARGLPHLAGQDDAGIDADDVVAALDDGLPPLPLDVVLQLDAERPVVPGRAEPAVDLAGRVDEPPALAEADDGVHAVGGHGLSPSNWQSAGVRRQGYEAHGCPGHPNTGTRQLAHHHGNSSADQAHAR